ncbi:MAG: endopeptidase La [Muribaculaceae bacterium]
MKHSEDENPQILPLGQIQIDDTVRRGEPDYDCMAVLPTRNLVLFPGVTVPIGIERPASSATVNTAMTSGKPIVIVCQRDPSTDWPTIEQLYPLGVVADVLKVFSLPDGSDTALVRARGKIRITGTPDGDKADKFMLTATAVPVRETGARAGDVEFNTLVDTIRKVTLSLIEAISNGMPNDVVFNLNNIKDNVEAVNFICAHSPLSPEVKQELLKCSRIKERAFKLYAELTRQEEFLEITKGIQEKARTQLSEQQRNTFLQQQMDAIRQELYGDTDDVTELRQRADNIGFSDALKHVVEKELGKLERLNPQSPDYQVQYSYIDTLLDLPWGKYSPLNTDFEFAKTELNQNHYGLDKVKDRILEQIAVLMNNPEGKSPILCLVGAPGVGKTSLGRSVAKALGRAYQRVSLGGLHDEAEIRGHRRTYIGAMPGRIMDAVKRSGTSNPVLLLDEVDKIGSDFKGDPSAALLEVLDPEQNCRFHDNYIDVDYDLSKVLFIATANTLQTLSQPLLDRMEIIDISGYLLEEKIEIATRHIIPRLNEEFALGDDKLSFAPEAIAKIIESYTAESGVRQLEQAIAAIFRKSILKKMSGEAFDRTITPSDVVAALGVEKYNKDRYEGNEYAGVVTGLAWTAVGGEILYVESSLSKSKGDKLTLTGNLGNVMKESATIAMQYVKSHAAQLGIPDELFEKYAAHIHVPEGAIPKDGPSAGITMATSLVSSFTQRKVRANIAMTGEITLRGKVLPVGGIKEKILAAKRAGITDIILSRQNRKDIEDINERYLHGLTFHYVSSVSDVVKIAITDEKVADAIEL